MLKIQKMFTSLLITLTGIYFIIGLILYFMQRELIYHPTQTIQHSFEEEIFVNNTVKITTTLLNKGKRDAILYFGGNAETVDLNAQNFSRAFPNKTIYLVKYRGYSGSEGTPTEENLYEDALYIFDHIKANFTTLSVIGRSLGSGVASYVASKRDIDKLVLITPFESLENVAQSILQYYPMGLLLKDKYDSLSRVQDIKAPTLFLVAGDDQLIKFHHTQKLFDQFKPQQATLKTLKNTDHNSLSDTAEYYSILSEFLKDKH